MTSAVVLHDLGSDEAGGPWRAVVPEGWLAPDLPGHGGTPAPRHGAYDPLGPATLARWELGGSGLLVGLGQNAHGALIVAAGGGCERVAVVDGLWGPWQPPDEQVDEMYTGLRRVADDAAAIAPPPSAGRDPRTLHGYGVHVSAAFCEGFWGSVTVPVLVVETPRSITPPAERAGRIGWFGGPSTLVELAEETPAAVVEAIVSWIGA